MTCLHSALGMDTILIDRDTEIQPMYEVSQPAKNVSIIKA